MANSPTASLSRLLTHLVDELFQRHEQFFNEVHRADERAVSLLRPLVQHLLDQLAEPLSPRVSHVDEQVERLLQLKVIPPPLPDRWIAVFFQHLADVMHESEREAPVIAVSVERRSMDNPVLSCPHFLRRHGEPRREMSAWIHRISPGAREMLRI